MCIIAPWNYPVQLLLAPLVPALAAGNTAVLKPSEVTPTVAAAIADLIPRYLDERAVAVVTGAVDETTVLLEQRFDHIFYTGNGTVGRVVMTAAAKHLTPVTLELGGKSPAIVAADANIQVAARRIAWGKFVNAGQTCVAPDHVLVEAVGRAGVPRRAVRRDHRVLRRRPEHVTRLRAHRQRASLRPADGSARRRRLRLDGRGRLGRARRQVHRADRARRRQARRGRDGRGDLRADPAGASPSPTSTRRSASSTIATSRSRCTRSARTSETLEKIVDRTSSGGVTLNHVLLHLAVPDLPFGGVGPSGMGAYHGKAGFDIFSHAKPVLDKPTRPDPSLMYPPYTSFKAKLLRRFL